MCRVLSGRERERAPATSTSWKYYYHSTRWRFHTSISFRSQGKIVHVRRPLVQVFKNKKIFIVLEYFLKQGQDCSTSIHLQNLNISKLTADLGYNDYLGTKK